MFCFDVDNEYEILKNTQNLKDGLEDCNIKILSYQE